MVQGPINYSGLLEQLDVSPLMQGLQLRNQGQALQEQSLDRQAMRADQQQRIQLAQAKFTADQANDTAYQQGLNSYLANPTPQALLELSARFPEHQKALQEGADSYSAGQKNDLVVAATSTLGALSAGKTDLAVKTLNERRDALAKAGINTDQTDAVIDLVKSGKIKEAQGYLGYALSGLIGPEHSSSMLQTLGIGAKAEAADAAAARADRGLDLRERALDASIARSDAASSRADRREARLAGGGASGGSSSKRTKSLPSGFVLD